MAAQRTSGGPGRSRFTSTWQGATVLRQWQAQIQAGLEAESAEIEADLKASIHVDTGEMRDKAFAEVTVSGTKRTIRAGSRADHTFYEEVEPNHHPVIRPTLDRHAPHVTRKIAAARGGR